MELVRGDTHEANNYRECIQEYSPAMTFASMGLEINSLPEYGP
jgi:hypothetical protein